MEAIWISLLVICIGVFLGIAIKCLVPEKYDIVVVPVVEEKPEIPGPSLDKIIGHEKFIGFVKKLIRQFFVDNKPIPHMLFYGTSGTGKTALASALAKELGVSCYFITGTQLSTKPEILKLISKIKEGDIIVVDEVHRLREMHATMIYSILQDSNYAVDGKLIEVPKATFIAATTHEGQLPTALRNRFTIKIQFRPYTDNQIKKIIKIGHNFKESIIDEIAKISFGIPRDALTLSQALSATIDNDLLATMEEFVEVRNLLGYDKNGLTYAERDAIRYLIANENKPVGIATLANAINVEKITVEERVKPKLLQLGLAKTNGTRGLNLTNPGLDICIEED
jgi:holliday junction DNA helicase RuvB